MLSPTVSETGRNSASGEPRAIPVSTGAMSVSALLTSLMALTSPPRRSNAAANASARLRVYTSPTWIAAAVPTPISCRRKCATASPWWRSLCAVR